MIVNHEISANAAKPDVDGRHWELKAERNAGFREGALAVFTVVLMIGAFWYGLQTAPML